ncbi:MAG TPA: phosphatidate cytidylyltransferase [Aliidiomarina sp.]|nr:phosphatidate cytidylyltransferase [Aliidiomarina sp.]
MLKKRLATASVLIPLALGAIFLLPLHWFAWITLIVLVMAAWEWSPLMGVHHIASRLLYCAIVAVLIAVTAWLTPVDQIWSAEGLAQAYLYPVIIGCIWWAVSFLLVCNYPRSHCVWVKSRAYVALIGVLILVPAWSALMSLRALSYEADVYFGSWVLLFIFSLVWAADVGAYFSGKRFGKHKLMPEVSPNKTKEGFLGGLTLALVVMIAVATYVEVPRDTLTAFFLVSLLTVVMSVIGDLNESMFKRCAGVKDSGSLLPGHGGLLDRIDSLTSALPVFLLGYLWLIY